ncbi:MAG: type III-A CRISPR-associated RAMP protein Csm5 [Candidatus Caldatribacteriaceae bacterium]
MREISKNEPYIGGNVFRRETHRIGQDVLRFVRVSDSFFVSWDKLVVYELKCLTPRGSIPMLVVSIPQNVEFSFDPWFKKVPNPEYWENLFRGGEGVLLEVIRSYTQQVLEKEIQILSTLKIYDKLSGFYRKIQPRLQKQILFRLGFGKTYYFSSVGCLLSEKELREVFSKDRRVRIGVSFPSTRFVISSPGDGQTPLGWIVVAKTG